MMIDTAILAIGAMLGVALVGTLIAIWTRLGKIGSAVESLTQRVDHDRDERLRLWQKIDEHADRLTRIEAKQENAG